MQEFYIGPMSAGLTKNVKPFDIPDNAYSILNNAYVYRGAVRKRWGSRFLEPGNAGYAGKQQLQSRLRVKLTGVVPGTGNWTGTVPLSAPNTPIVTPAIGQMFSVNDHLFTVNVLGGAANPLLRSDDQADAATFHTTAGAGCGDVVINNVTVGASVYYYPALPVMGFTSIKTAGINNEISLAFDTRFVYNVTADGWDRHVPAATSYWPNSADTYHFFWATSWIGGTAGLDYLYVTNDIAADGLKYFDGTNWFNWAPQYTAVGGAKFIQTCRIIVPFKSRLLLFNVVEDGVRHVNRCRFSWAGDPVDASGLAFRADDPRGGGFEDVPVNENIITVGFLRDRLIVFCESSTWELVATGFDLRPFVFQQINASLGAESTFSAIEFDTAIVGVGNVGVHSCDGNTVNRIDQKIPDEVFQIHNSQSGPERVAGIRDYYNELAYWSFPSITRTATNPYNDRVLVYNYSNDTWAFFDDSITAFGYIQNGTNGLTWEQDHDPIGNDISTWEVPNINALTKVVIAGNQEGYTFIIDAEKSSNTEALQITDIGMSGVNPQLTVINHNLDINDYIRIEHCVYHPAAATLNNTIYKVLAVQNENQFTIDTLDAVVALSYRGAGTITRVSQIDILTKQYNFFAQQGVNIALESGEFIVDSTDNGEVTVDYLLSTADTSMIDASRNSASILSSGILETFPYPTVPFEADQYQLIHQIYFQAEGHYVQMRFWLTPDQMIKYTLIGGLKVFVAEQDFRLYTVVYSAEKAGPF